MLDKQELDASSRFQKIANIIDETAAPSKNRAPDIENFYASLRQLLERVSRRVEAEAAPSRPSHRT